MNTVSRACFAFLLLPVACLAGCGSAGPAQTATVQPRAVHFAIVEMRPLASELTASGRLVPREEAAVSSQLSGFPVTRVMVDQGADVRAGQILARLDDRLLRTDIAQQRANLAQRQIAAEKAEAAVGRVVGLDDSGVLSPEAIAERRYAARTARAAVDQARAELNAQLVRQQLMQIRAPVDGRVLSRSVRPGDIASSGTVMFRIARGDRIELDAEIPEQAMALVKPGQPAEVILPDNSHLAGSVRLIGAEVSLSTNLAHARILLPRLAALRPGGFAQLLLRQQAPAPVRTVPATAIQYSANGATVVVIGKGNIVSTSPVTLGRRSGDYLELIDGPQAGTRVLTGGQGFVLDGDKVAPVATGRGAA